MSKQDTGSTNPEAFCPYCQAERVESSVYPPRVYFTCNSFRNPMSPLRGFTRTVTCYERQISSLQDRLTTIVELDEECFAEKQEKLALTREALRMAMTNDWNNHNDSNGGSVLSIDERVQRWLDEARTHLWMNELAEASE